MQTIVQPLLLKWWAKTGNYLLISGGNIGFHNICCIGFFVLLFLTARKSERKMSPTQHTTTYVIDHPLSALGSEHMNCVLYWYVCFIVIT